MARWLRQSSWWQARNLQGQSEGQGELVAGSLRLLELLCRVLWVRLEGAYTHKGSPSRHFAKLNVPSITQFVARIDIVWYNYQGSLLYTIELGNGFSMEFGMNPWSHPTASSACYLPYYTLYLLVNWGPSFACWSLGLLSPLARLRLPDVAKIMELDFCYMGISWLHVNFFSLKVLFSIYVSPIFPFSLNMLFSIYAFLYKCLLPNT